MSHHRIEAEAKQVATKQKAPRNVLTDPSPDIAPDVLAGILPDGRVTGYEKGIAHKGTFYAEFEGAHLYDDESFLRVVMYGDEFHDKETRIPLKMLAAAGFARPAPDSRDAALEILTTAINQSLHQHPAVAAEILQPALSNAAIAKEKAQ